MAQESQTSETAVGSPATSAPQHASTQELLTHAQARMADGLRRLKQLALILWAFLHDHVFLPGSIVALGLYTAAEKFYLAKKHRIFCDCHQFTAFLSRLKARRLSGIAMMTTLVVVVFSTTFYSFGIEVSVGGKPVGYVMNQADYQDSVTRVQNRVSQIMGHACSVNPDVTFSFGLVERDKVLEGAKLDGLLFSQIEGISELYVLSIDGQVVGACRERDTIDQVLKSVTASQNPNVKKQIASKVAISHEAVDSSYLRSAEEIKALLTSKKAVTETHVVVPDETVASICKQYNMKPADLMALNPGIDPTWLVSGQQLTIKKTAPLLSVRSVQRVTQTVGIAYPQKKISVSSLYAGKQTIKTNGVTGSKKIVSDVTYVDGRETGRTVVSEAVVKQPTTEVVLVGTKPVPAKAATGTFRRPTSGAVISSNYGYRRSGFHTGVDFALAYGSPVRAADGGRVSFAGWKGGYGYLVIISHGNGLQTYYGHNSRLLVSAGDRVAKGEQIAKIGSTGNSTGPHCHFEVRVNGRHVNPWRYIS